MKQPAAACSRSPVRYAPRKQPHSKHEFDVHDDHNVDTQEGLGVAMPEARVAVVNRIQEGQDVCDIMDAVISEARSRAREFIEQLLHLDCGEWISSLAEPTVETSTVEPIPAAQEEQLWRLALRRRLTQMWMNYSICAFATAA